MANKAKNSENNNNTGADVLDVTNQQESSTAVATTSTDDAALSTQFADQTLTVQTQADVYDRAEAMLAAFDELDQEMEITGTYVAMEAGDTYMGLFLGWTEVSSTLQTDRNDGGKVKCAQFMDATEQKGISIFGDAVVVSALEGLVAKGIQLPIPVKLVCNGMKAAKGNSNHKYRDIRVSILGSSKANIG